MTKCELPPIGSRWEDIIPWVDHLYVTAHKSLQDYLYDILDCGGDDITRKFIRHMLWATKVFDIKQQNYGPENIAKLGESGVMSRVEDDKFSRLRTLNANPDNALQGEPALDAWHDSAVYGLIGAMIHVGDWPTREELGMNNRSLEQVCRDAIEAATSGDAGLSPSEALQMIKEKLASRGEE